MGEVGNFFSSKLGKLWIFELLSMRRPWNKGYHSSIYFYFCFVRRKSAKGPTLGKKFQKSELDQELQFGMADFTKYTEIDRRGKPQNPQKPSKRLNLPSPSIFLKIHFTSTFPSVSKQNSREDGSKHLSLHILIIADS